MTDRFEGSFLDRSATEYATDWSSKAEPGEIFEESSLANIVKRIIPQMIAADICGVQPMSGPVGGIFSMRIKSPFDSVEPTESQPTEKIKPLPLFDEWQKIKEELLA